MNTLHTSDIIPNRVWFSLTGSCNNKCTWCYRNGSEINSFLDPELIVQAINTLSKYGTKKCTFIGGEPTLHKDLSYLIEVATSEMHSCTVVTNGRALHNSIPESWINNERLNVVVSLHGANEDHYTQNTGEKNGFKQTCSAIHNLVESHINHSVNVVVGKENIPMLDEFITTVAGIGAKTLCFTIAISSLDDTYETDPVEITKYVRSIHEMCNKLGQPHVLIFSLPWCLIDQSLLEELIKKRNLMFNCPVDKGKGVVIKENGGLTVCTHLSSHEILSPNKTRLILSDPNLFHDFWNSSEMSLFRKTVNVYRHLACTECKYRLYCKGGCPLWWEQHNFKQYIHRR